MPNIDSRLVDCDSPSEIAENFNRVMARCDSLAITVDALKALAVCIVTFDSDGGSAVDSQTVAFEGTATEPTDPTKAEYVFGGWNLDEALYDFDAPITANITLTAVWTEA